MTEIRALLRKEIVVLFGSPIAYLVLTMVALLTSIVFFEHLRLYNHQLFLYASSSMGGFETDTIPDYINLRNTVFYPVMEQLGVLMLLVIPLVTMRVFAEERASGTDELLLTAGVDPTRIVFTKFVATFGFVALMMTVSFVYPVTAITQGGLGFQHLLAVFIGLVSLGIGVAAVGLVCSALTRSQIVAAASAIAVCYFLYDFAWSYAFIGEGLAGVLEVVAMHGHYVRFSEGLVDIADIVYFVALAIAAGGIVRSALLLRRTGV